MKFTLSSAIFAVLSLTATAFAHAGASTIVIDPSSDGSLYTCAGCNVVDVGAYVLTSGYIQGDVNFSTAQITGPSSQVLLSVNPYALPLWGQNVAVYGYQTTQGQLVASEANAGTYLGTLTLPANLGFGQPAYFNVTNFVNTVKDPYVGFNLRSTGTDVFSSTYYNYGLPPQLLVSSVPEPSSVALMLIGLLATFTVIRKKKIG